MSHDAAMTAAERDAAMRELHLRVHLTDGCRHDDCRFCLLLERHSPWLDKVRARLGDAS